MESNELKILKAMILMAETLNYSNTFKNGLIEKIKFMIDIEENVTDNCNYLESL